MSGDLDSSVVVGRRGSGVARWAVGLVLLAVVAVAAFWAGRVTLRPADVVVQSAAEAAEVEVVEQELGRVITLATTVTRQSEPVATNLLAGVVTRAWGGGEAGQGEVLYQVEQTPVLIVQGEVPFWRALQEGDRGGDVRQVQQMLSDRGVEVEVDGIWGSGTTRGVRAFQRENGFPITGGFERGALVAVAELPAPVMVDAELVWPGGVLSGGEKVVSVAAGEPSFVMEVTQPQAQMIPEGTSVTVQHGSLRWDGVVAAGSTTTDEGLVALSVTAPDGALVCGSECEELPATDGMSLLTEVAIVPPVTGPVVPVAALTTNPDGSVTVEVVTAAGVEARRVSVRTVADGLAVVEGLSAGERVRVFGPGEGSPEQGSGSTTGSP